EACMTDALVEEQLVETAPRENVAVSVDASAGTAAAPPEPAAPPALRRVLHLINGEHYSGAERVQDLLGLPLREHKYQGGFACLKPGRFPHLRRAQQSPLDELPLRWEFDLVPARQVARPARGAE